MEIDLPKQILYFVGFTQLLLKYAKIQVSSDLHIPVSGQNLPVVIREHLDERKPTFLHILIENISHLSNLFDRFFPSLLKGYFSWF